MSFVDNIGLSHFLNKLKEKFVQTINNIPPEDGNIELTMIETAQNLLGDKKTYSSSFIYRTSGGDTNIDSGAGQLALVRGAVNIEGRQPVQLELSGTNGIMGLIISTNIFEINENIQKTAGTYVFTYTPPIISSSAQSSGSWTANGQWSFNNSPINLSDFGLSALGIQNPSLVWSKVSSQGTINSIVPITFTQNEHIIISDTYIFNYTVDDNDNPIWQLNDVSFSTLNDFGITLGGTWENGDSIVVIYNASTPNLTSTLTASYVPGTQGNITMATPTGFVSTGFNQFNKNDPNFYIQGATIYNGQIVNGAENDYVCFCRAVGGLEWGYMAYSPEGRIKVDTGGLGWCESFPEIGTTNIIQTKNPQDAQNPAFEDKNTPYQSTMHFKNDGYLVVAVSNNKNDLVIHTRWDDEDDDAIGDYSLDEIEFPLQGTRQIGSQLITEDLPISLYGMPAVKTVTDILDPLNSKYYKYIEVIPYSEINIADTRANYNNFDYDNTYIYQVLSSHKTQPIEYIEYDINMRNTYIVNDFGTEEILNTTIPIEVNTIYYENLRNKIKNDTLTITEQTPALTLDESEQILYNFGWKVVSEWEDV